MELEQLKIKNFRNIRELTLTPGEGVNVIYGDNAQGKTNLIEAIYLFTGQKSFRQAKESDFILFGETKAELFVTFFAGGRSQEATLSIGGKKTATLNELPVTPSELTGRFFAVVFSPAELSLVQDGPALRRNFLDNAISQVMPRYIKTMASLNRALYQRNSLLADIRWHNGREDLLDTWDHSFSRLSYIVINARRRYVARLAPYAAQFYRDIAGGKEEFSLLYQSSLVIDWENQTTHQAEEAILAELQKNRGEDLKNGFTTLGPQRDDLDFSIAGTSARSFGSQGQQRSCALALKLAECSLIREICGEAPIVLLDDVFSELDKSRRDYFIHRVDKGQVFITSCDRTGLRSFAGSNRIHIVEGAVSPPKKPKRQGNKNVSALGAGNAG